MRIILFTGKGGVGKTTLSAATALSAAQKGHKTLVISTDAAHSLSDSFDIRLGNQPQKIDSNLYGQEIDALEQIENKWGKIKSYLSAFFASQGIDQIEAEEMSIFPGMEELFSLMEICSYQKTSQYEVIIVDCAPTGDTLRLLSAPEITSWYLKHIFPFQRTAAKAVRPVAPRIFPFPFPDDDIFEDMKNLTSQLAEMKEILADTQKTSIRLVINPEKMVIKEAQRSFTFFNLFGYAVDSIIVNRLIPQEVKDQYFSKWKSTQDAYQKMIKECFSPIPILNAELFNQEISGRKMLNQLAVEVYGKKDPTQLFFSQNPIHIQKNNGGFNLSIYLPFLEKKDLDVSRNREELFIKAGHYKRSILLPRSLLNYEINEARFENQYLNIRFNSQTS